MPGHVADGDQVDLGDGLRAVDPLQVDARGGLDRGRAGSRRRRAPCDSAIEKQPAWAAPMSSSGLVPSPSSKRDLNE